MQRRTFIGSGAAAIAAVATAACDGGGTAKTAQSTLGRSLSASSRTPATSATSATSANWAALGRGLDGTLVRPGDADWPTARKLYNTRFDSLKPAAVAYVANTDDIRTTLAYARAHGIQVAIRNGGHCTPAGPRETTG